MGYKRIRKVPSTPTNGAGMNIKDYRKLFPTEEDAINYYIKLRYNGVITCPHCGNAVNIYRYKNLNKQFHCYKCKSPFSPLHDTIFWRSHVEIRDWFYVIMSFLNDRSGISARNIQRQMGISYPTALRMLHKIREAMSNEEIAKTFQGIVEVDETYIGGKPRKYNNKEGKPIFNNKRGRGTNKVPLVGVKNRETGEVFIQVMLPNKEGRKLSSKQLLDVIDKKCKEKATVITDEFRAYNILTTKGYVHLTVNHSKGQYSAGDGIHTNGIEGFWSVFKMGWVGTYRHMSVKYLQRYANEFSFRQNFRLHKCAFDVLLGRTVIDNPELIKSSLIEVA